MVASSDTLTPEKSGQLEPGNRRIAEPKGYTMAIANKDTTNSAQDQYKAGFDETPAAAVEPTDNEAFGIEPPTEAVAAAESAEPAGTETPAEDVGEAPEAVEPAAEKASEIDQKPLIGKMDGMAMMGDEPTDPKDIQRKASWEGRLKKMEAELMAKKAAQETPVVEALEDVSEQADASGDPALSDAAEQVSAQVESGAMTATQAMKQLADDFGEEFVKMIEVIASAKAGEVGGQAIAGVKGEVDNIISHISSSAEKAPFKEIAAAFPDFNEDGNSPEFKQFVQGAGADAERVAGGGSATEVIDLIKSFKSSQAPKEAAPVSDEPTPSDAGQADPEGADAAAGVRSGGLRLPTEPADNNDFESAFNEATKMK